MTDKVDNMHKWKWFFVPLLGFAVTWGSFTTQVSSLEEADKAQVTDINVLKAEHTVLRTQEAVIINDMEHFNDSVDEIKIGLKDVTKTLHQIEMNMPKKE